jgi:glycosyltransferase involved in cell wall biosynthesis
LTATPDQESDELGHAMAEEVTWLEEFHARHGRPLRVLHIGNVAGNAYLNAKFLRSYGVESHVLSYDYYYPIGTPEWEDGVTRPRWFVQGPIVPSARYLHALLDGRRFGAWLAWWRLRDAALVAAVGAGQVAFALDARRDTPFWRARARVARGLWHVQAAAAHRFWKARHRIALLRFRVAYVRSYAWNWLMRVFFLRIRSLARRLAGHPRATARAMAEHSVERPSPLVARILEDFNDYFPDRPDRLTAAEAEQWAYRVKVWQKLLGRYDIVQGYGTDVIRPYVAGRRPYVGFEHGTLRDFTLGDDFVHRMTALSYRAADHVFITNGDCLAYAQALGIVDYTPMIHPLDVERYTRGQKDEVARVRHELAADVVLLCPLRHDWAIKGTDVHLRALPAIRAANPEKSVCVVLTEWGADVEASRKLLDDINCTDLARWVAPLGRDDLIAHMRAADVVLDQIALPHFGATAPQALATGTPVIMSYRPESTEWIVGEPAPILSAFTPDEVASAVQTALDPAWLEEFTGAAARWTRRWHHPDRIVLEHCRTYRRLLEAH